MRGIRGIDPELPEAVISSIFLTGEQIEAVLSTPTFNGLMTQDIENCAKFGARTCWLIRICLTKEVSPTLIVKT